MKRKAKLFFYHLGDNDIQVLFGKRKDSSGEEFWWIPGGSAEEGEELLEGAARELQEELIVTSSLLHSIKKYSVQSPPPFIRYATDRSEVTVFLIHVQGEKETPLCKEEFTEMKWFSLSQLPSDLSREYANLSPYISTAFLKSITV